MLARVNRLQASGEIREAVRLGRRRSGTLLVLHLHKVATSAEPKAGFVTSRLVGPAVARNAVRRRLRHILRSRLKMLPEGSHLVVRALPSAGRAHSSDLARELDRLLVTALAPANGRAQSRDRRPVTG